MLVSLGFASSAANLLVSRGESDILHRQQQYCCSEGPLQHILLFVGSRLRSTTCNKQASEELPDAQHTTPYVQHNTSSKHAVEAIPATMAEAAPHRIAGRRPGDAPHDEKATDGKPLIGVLALQGSVEEHIDVLHKLGADTREIRVNEEVAGVDCLIFPVG